MYWLLGRIIWSKYQIHIEMAINVFVFIDSTSLENTSVTAAILDFYKLFAKYFFKRKIMNYFACLYKKNTSILKGYFMK